MPKDEAKAKLYFDTAARLGHAPAQVELGRLIFKSEPTQAAWWFKSAGDQGFPEGEKEYAVCVEKGFAVA